MSKNHDRQRWRTGKLHHHQRWVHQVIPNQFAKATDPLPSSPTLLPKEKGAQGKVPRPWGEGLKPSAYKKRVRVARSVVSIFGFGITRYLAYWLCGIVVMAGLVLSNLSVAVTADSGLDQVTVPTQPTPVPTDALTPLPIITIPTHTLYVATTGLDTNTGDVDQPLRTIQRAVDLAQASDTVLIKGGTYYERQLNFHNSGTATQPIVIENAPGESVIIDHGLQISGWTTTDGTIYQATPIVQDAVRDNPQNTQRVVVGANALVRVGRQEDLKEGTFWVAPATGNLFVWAIDSINPASQETVLINWNGDDRTGIHLFDTANHIVLDGLHDRGAETAIWAANFVSKTPNQDLTIRNCEIEIAWSNAIRFDNWLGATVSNCKIHDTGLVQFPRNSGADWPHAIIGFNTDQIKLIANKIHDNNGEGVGPFWGCRDWTIVDNEVFDNWSVNVYIDTDEGNITINGNLIYNTGKYHQFERDFADGIRIANETADVNHNDSTPGVDHVTATNNIIIGTGGGIRFFPYQNGLSYLTNSLIANNTIHAVVSGTESILVNRGDDVRIVNNIADAGAIAVQSGLGSSGILVSHNLIPTSQSVTTDSSLIAHDVDIIGDPSYTVGTGYSATNYQLQSNSPARNAGIALTEITSDRWGTARTESTAYTIGAYEFLPSPIK